MTITRGYPGLDLDPLVDEVLNLRHGSTLPSIDQGPTEVLARLTDIRTRLDRVEEILSTVIRFRGRVQAECKVATAEAEELWAAKVVEPSRRGRTQTEWGAPAPRERYAEADLATLEPKRKQRQLERAVDTANTAVEVIQRAHRGLDSTRQDLHLILRAMTVESQLER